MSGLLPFLRLLATRCLAGGGRFCFDFFYFIFFYFLFPFFFFGYFPVLVCVLKPVAGDKCSVIWVHPLSWGTKFINYELSD